MTFILNWCRWLEQTAWATSLRESSLLFPFIEGSHILALALSVGTIMLLDLRLLGLTLRDQPVSRVMRQVSPWMLAGFAVMFVTGGLLFGVHAEKAYLNVFFRIKMLLLAAAGVNAAVYQVRYYPSMADWDAAADVPLGARAIAALSLLFWIGAITCGRTMAYEL